jgi:hypothetical protein
VVSYCFKLKSAEAGCPTFARGLRVSALLVLCVFSLYANGRAIQTELEASHAKRVQIPGYEAVYEMAHDAVSEGVITPSISAGFYLQCEIWEVLEWAKYRTSAKTRQLESASWGACVAGNSK